VGFINSAYMVGDLAFTLDLVSRKRKELYIGVLNLLISPFSFISPLIGGKIADAFGYKALFIFAFGVSVYSLAFLLKHVQDPRKDMKEIES
ncbi:MAG: MFS transporter, partial [Thermotoga sp.]